MKLLFLGDVMGRAGRAAVTARLPGLRAQWALDFVVVNAENATSGARGKPPQAPRSKDAASRTPATPRRRLRINDTCPN